MTDRFIFFSLLTLSSIFSSLRNIFIALSGIVLLVTRNMNWSAWGIRKAYREARNLEEANSLLYYFEIVVR